jgi:hypothetical protein
MRTRRRNKMSNLKGNGCWNCEYGDYNNQSESDECNYIVDGDPLFLTGGMRWFISIMGCGKWRKVTEGNPRLYNPDEE